MISCKIANAGKYDLIIPSGWWHEEHPLRNIADPTRWVFEEAKCHAHVEDEAVADMLKWDETVAYDEKVQYVGRIEMRTKEEYIWKCCQSHTGSIRTFLKRKRRQCWHLEGPLITPSTSRKGKNPHGARFTRYRHTCWTNWINTLRQCWHRAK